MVDGGFARGRGGGEWAFSFGGLRGLAGGFGREGWGINGDVCWARFLGCRNVVGMLRWECGWRFVYSFIVKGMAWGWGILGVLCGERGLHT